MKRIAQICRPISHEYLFPCICMEHSLVADFHKKICDFNIVASILDELTTQCSPNYDMSCLVVDAFNKKYRRRISWKPLSENTWNRNNQPKCDNIRITAVSKAFVTLAKTRYGNVELHVSGPNIIGTKPYARLGVGINMLSKQHWKPGFLFMTGSNKNLKQELNFELRYPVDFEGRITIKWPKKGPDLPLTIFDISTRRNNIFDPLFPKNEEIGRFHHKQESMHMEDAGNAGTTCPGFGIRQHCCGCPNARITCGSLPNDIRFNPMDFNLLNYHHLNEPDVLMDDKDIQNALLSIDFQDICNFQIDNTMMYPQRQHNNVDSINNGNNDINANSDRTCKQEPWPTNVDMTETYAYSGLDLLSSPSMAMSCDDISEEPCPNFNINASHPHQTMNPNIPRTCYPYGNVANTFATQYW